MYTLILDTVDDILKDMSVYEINLLVRIKLTEDLLRETKLVLTDRKKELARIQKDKLDKA